jgi:hypothetical protein
MLTKLFFLKRKIKNGVEFVYNEDETSESSGETDESDELIEEIKENENVRENETENNQDEAPRSTSDIPEENRQESVMSIDMISIIN